MNRGYRGATMASLGSDSPAWTFGLNPKIPGPRVPGVGTYNIAGRLESDSVGTHFSRVGTKPTCPRADAKRLVFGTEVEDKGKPGPGAYDTTEKRPLRWDVRPGDAKNQTPRFPESRCPTDAGPGDYISPDFDCQGPAHSLPGRVPKSPAVPDSPGPGQYIRVQLSTGHEGNDAAEGFGKRDSPRFPTEAASNPGPGAYQSADFRPQVGKDITFGRQLRPAGWTSKIKEIARFSWELDDSDDGKECSQKRVGRFRAPLQRFAKRSRRPSSAPPSSRFRRACARGRRLDRNDERGGGGQRKESHHEPTASRIPRDKPRSIADAVKEDGRRRRAQAAKAAENAAGVSPKAALMGSSPQRPPDPKPTPGPGSYRPVTRDEAARNAKVVSVGGKSRRELFPASPDTPGPEWYAPEITQGPALNEECRERRRTALHRHHAAVRTKPSRWPAGNNTRDGTTVLKKRPAPSGSSSPTSSTAAAAVPRRVPEVGTFGSSERFSKDTTPRPGVGEYDLRAAERAASGASAAIPVTIGRKPTGLPYNPHLNRYLRTDGIETPSVHDYNPEPAIGGGGKDGLGGHAPAPPAWSFGGKRPSPRPPDGPGPGKFRPPYNNRDDPCCCSPTAGARFGAGREVISGSVSGVPWVEAEERAARGDGGGGGAKLYLPERTRMGARAFMHSRPLPRPRR